MIGSVSLGNIAILDRLPQLKISNQNASKKPTGYIQVTEEELISWKKRVLFELEAHFSDQQLHRIAEFGRARANLVDEARAYVVKVEHDLRLQFVMERDALVAEAKRHVDELHEKTRVDMELLSRQLSAYKAENKELRSMVDRATSQDVEAQDPPASQGMAGPSHSGPVGIIRGRRSLVGAVKKEDFDINSINEPLKGVALSEPSIVSISKVTKSRGQLRTNNSRSRRIPLGPSGSLHSNVLPCTEDSQDEL